MKNNHTFPNKNNCSEKRAFICIFAYFLGRSNIGGLSKHSLRGGVKKREVKSWKSWFNELHMRRWVCCVLSCSAVSSSLQPCGLYPCRLLCPQGFSRQEYCSRSRLPCPPPGDLPHPGIEPASLASPALANRFFTTEPPGKDGYIQKTDPKMHC